MTESQYGTVPVVGGATLTLPCLLDDPAQLLWATRTVSLYIACGFNRMDTVEVLDSSSGRWYSAQPVPMGGHQMSSAVVGDYWYLSSDSWKDGQPHIFFTHLPTLISSAMSAAQTNTTSIWQELPTPPVSGPTLLALQSHLLLVGGGGSVQKLHHYDPQTKEWRKCGQLPVGLAGPSCAVLPSGELMVVGGLMISDFSKQVWIGKYNYILHVT